MRTAHALLALPLAFSALGFLPQDEKQDGRPPMTAFQEDEQQRLEEALPGVWILTSFQTPGRGNDLQEVAGFAMFQDGYASIIIQTRALEDGLLGTELAYYFQAGVHRYQVSQAHTLQVASIVGFDNMNEEGELQFIGNRSVREHPLRIDGDAMTLSSPGGSELSFRRANKTTFPTNAVEFLRQHPGGSDLGAGD